MAKQVFAIFFSSTSIDLKPHCEKMREMVGFLAIDLPREDRQLRAHLLETRIVSDAAHQRQPAQGRVAKSRSGRCVQGRESDKRDSVDLARFC